MAILDRPPAPGERSGVLDHLRVSVDSLRPSEQRIAERMLDNPGLAIALSISEFAEVCGVSQPTVSRLSRRLGFPSYGAMRLAIANDHAAPERGGAALSTEGTLDAAADALARTAQIPEAAFAIRHASRVELWPTPECTQGAERLADRLAGLDIPAACATRPSGWAVRAATMDHRSVVILICEGTAVESRDAALRTATLAGARVLVFAVDRAHPLPDQSTWTVPVPRVEPPELAFLVIERALVKAIQQAEPYPEAAAPASPWRPWAHQQPVFLPTSGDPIPAILLRHEDPPQDRPLVIYLGGFAQPKEGSLPGPAGPLGAKAITAALLNAGYHVLLADLPAHGERKRAWEDTSDLVVRSFNRSNGDVLRQARLEAPALVDGVLGLGIATRSGGIAVVGSSWGGLNALLTLAGDQRIACAAAILPVCRLTRLEPLHSLPGRRALAEAEPGPALGTALGSRPLLLVAAEHDDQAVPDDIVALTESLRPAYRKAPDNLAYRLLDGAAHAWDPRQAELTTNWLAQHVPLPPDER